MFQAEKGIWDSEKGIFVREGEPSPFQNIPQAMWWAAVTMTTVGYGDSFPVGWVGKFIAVMAMLLGVLFIALPVAIISGKFSEAYKEMEQSSNIEKEREELLKNLTWKNSTEKEAIVCRKRMERLAHIQHKIKYLLGHFEE